MPEQAILACCIASLILPARSFDVELICRFHEHEAFSSVRIAQ